MKKSTKIILYILGAGFVVYSGFLIKKAVFDKGYPSKKMEKDVYLGYYVIMKGLPNTPQNRRFFNDMSLEELKRAVGDTGKIIE